MKMIKAVVINVILISIFSHAFAQDKKHVQLKNEVFVEQEVVKEDGTKEYKLVPPGKVVPGDEVIYVITFTNVSQEDVSDIVITDNIPNDSLYKANSAFGAGTEITFSADGGKSYASADALKVKDKNGQIHTATPESYTAIKWVFKNTLKPGAEGSVTFRTIVK